MIIYEPPILILSSVIYNGVNFVFPYLNISVLFLYVIKIVLTYYYFLSLQVRVLFEYMTICISFNQITYTILLTYLIYPIICFTNGLSLNIGLTYYTFLLMVVYICEMMKGDYGTSNLEYLICLYFMMIFSTWLQILWIPPSSICNLYSLFINQKQLFCQEATLLSQKLDTVLCVNDAD